MVLLSDERIHRIDNKEKIISLRGKHNKILIDETRSQISSRSDLFCYVRESVLEKLVHATNYLSDGY